MSAVILNDRLEIRAVDVLHDDEERVVAHADIEHLHAIGMGKMGADPRLIEKHSDELLLLGQLGQNPLDGHGLFEALETRAFGSKYLRHATGSDLLSNPIPLLLLLNHACAPC